MNNMLSFLKKQRPHSILGLALSGNQLEATVVRRLNGSLRVQQNVIAELALSPLSGDPELVGREIRNHLGSGGIRERRCALSIPPGWVLDRAGEAAGAGRSGRHKFSANRGRARISFGVRKICISPIRDIGWRLANSMRTLLGVPRNHLETLEKVLKAAQLKPVTFSMGIAAMDFPGKGVSGWSGGTRAGPAKPGPHGGHWRGIAVLRSLDGAMENEGAQRSIDAELVAREMRITLGQLPAALAEKTRVIRLFGRGDAVRRFARHFSTGPGNGLKCPAYGTGFGSAV